MNQKNNIHKAHHRLKWLLCCAGKLAVYLFILYITCNTSKAQEYYLPTEKTPNTPRQYNTGRFSFALSFGAAIPVSDFGSANVKGSFWDFNSPDSTRLQGFALTGFHFDFTLWYRINDFLGVEVFYGGNVNDVDINTFSNTVRYISTTTQPSYYTPEYLIGPYCYFQEGKLTGKLSAMIGMVTNTYPPMNMAINDTTTLAISMNNGGSGFAYSFNAQLEYAISPRTSIYFNAGYTGATISYAGYTVTETAIGKFAIYRYILPDPTHPNDITLMNTGIIRVSAGFVFAL